MSFLPITKEEMTARGWEAADFVYVTGDAYVDHPSFGPAIITRLLESQGYRVAVLAQPRFDTPEDMTRFGRPRLGFLVSGGNIDSMVAHYTAARRLRSEDFYSPGCRAGLRPDRATIVYCRLIREAYGDIPIVIGGVDWKRPCAALPTTITGMTLCVPLFWRIPARTFSSTAWASTR